MSEVEKPLPEWVKRRILEKARNKALTEEALRYIKLVEREDGTLWVKEEFKDTDRHALLFTVLSCVNYARRLLRGEDIEDD